MSLNSEMHEVYLSMPMEAGLMPELKGLPFWARMTHEVMMAEDPAKITALAKAGKLERFLKQKQEALSVQARKMEREWRKLNPLEADADYLRRSIWMNHGKQAVREQLISELAKSFKTPTEH